MVSQKTGNNSTSYPAKSYLGINPKDVPTSHKDTNSIMFIAVLFIIARNWKQPRWFLTDEWIKKMWYIYTMEYFSAIKNKVIMSFASKWMELENIILSVVISSKGNAWYVFTYKWILVIKYRYHVTLNRPRDAKQEGRLK